MKDSLDYFDEKPFDLSHCIGVNFDNTPIHNEVQMIELGMGVTIKVIISVQENKEFFNVTEGELNWSDMQSMQDIV